MKTDRIQRLPPFFTQVIGSLPRPAAVIDLHRHGGDLSAGEFQNRIDDMVVFAIRLQEQAGLDVVSDGEWRRIHYVDEFLNRIGGFEKIRPFEHAGEKKLHLVVTHLMQPGGPVFARDAEFLRSHTQRGAKFALPSPFLIAVRYWSEEFSAAAYPKIEHFMEDLTSILRREAQALAEAGIDIIQLDDPALTYFCDRELIERGETHDDRLRRTWDPDQQIHQATDFINRIFDGLSAEVQLHCCHSVYKRTADVTGNYAPLLSRLQNLKVDRVNLEFAYQKTGEISDLQLLPPNTGVGMGVVDVRSERLQSVEEIESIAQAGADVLGPERIALNPDCGFAPDMGEPPTIDEAFEKLSRLTRAAARLRKRYAG